MSSRVLGLGAAMATAALLTAHPAAAAETARLVLVKADSAAGCVDEAGLRRMVVTRLNYDPFAAGIGTTLLVKVAERGPALVGSVEVVDAQSASHGTREIAIESGRCDELLKALSLSISIAIDPETALAEPAVEDEPPKTVVAPNTPPAPVAPADSPAPVVAAPPTRPATKPASPTRDTPEPAPAPRESVYALGVTAVSMLGVAPATSFGAELQARRTSGSWVLGAGGRIVGASGGIDEAGGLSTTVAAGHLQGCYVASPFEYCAIALAGATWARANGVALPRTDSALLLALGARVGLVAPLAAAWSVLAHAEVFGVNAPVRAQVDEKTVWSAPPAAGGFGVGIQRRFP